jgi:hypothetical protein
VGAGSERNGRESRPPGNSSNETIDQGLVKALAHPIRVLILEKLQTRTASPTELARETRESLGVVSYHVNALLGVDCLEQVRTQPKRGTIEHFFTARPRSFIGHQDWRKVPLSVRGGVTEEAVRTFIARVASAIEAGTIDSREETTLHWMPMMVDEQGWKDAAAILDRARRELTEVAADSRDRLGEKDGIPIVSGLAAFEVPES